MNMDGMPGDVIESRMGNCALTPRAHVGGFFLHLAKNSGFCGCHHPHICLEKTGWRDLPGLFLRCSHSCVVDDTSKTGMFCLSFQNAFSTISPCSFSCALGSPSPVRRPRSSSADFQPYSGWFTAMWLQAPMLAGSSCAHTSSALPSFFISASNCFFGNG